MSFLVKTAGWLGSVLAILALIIALLKQVIGFIGFLTMVIKIGIVLLFILLFVGVAALVFKAWQSGQRRKE
ncbi:MAG: hypothetical protein OEM82_14540 [Acidobacteriota bacterium]|nr:hypothetical protein [Acidobacteriota bacterium]MDH3530702.1 hypothetical protein [Acidobacteriota bacterium]